MNKQEVIIKAWGETLYPVLESNMKREGGSWYENWKNTGQFYGNFLPQGLRSHLYREDVENLNGWFYPIEIKGIKNNNGWTKIESENDLPENYGYFIFIVKETGKEEKNEWNGLFKKQIISHYSHWRPIIENPKPLY